MPPPILLGTLAGAGLGTLYGWLRTRWMNRTFAELRHDLMAASNTHAQEEIAYELARARVSRFARIVISALLLAGLGTLLTVLFNLSG